MLIFQHIMWDKDSSETLSRRERQVMEIVMRLGKATARDIEASLPDAPTYSAVRSIVRLLVEKELLIKSPQGRHNEFTLPVTPAKARVKMLQGVVHKFFADSVGAAAMALLGQTNAKLTKAEADALRELIKEAQEK